MTLTQHVGAVLVSLSAIGIVVAVSKVLWRWWCECLDGAANDIE